MADSLYVLLIPLTASVLVWYSPKYELNPLENINFPEDKSYIL